MQEKEPGSGWCCVVADHDCRASNVDRTRARCFSCGDFVCTSHGCSRVVKYYRYGRRRICATCQEMHGLVKS